MERFWGGFPSGQGHRPVCLQGQVIMGSAAALMAAQHAGTLGVGFSGGGFILPFFLGVIDMLYRDMAILKHSNPAAGASTGAIASTVATGVIPVEQMYDATNHLGGLCMQQDSCYGILQQELKKVAKGVLPSDAAERLSGHAYMAVVYAPSETKGPRHTLLTNFTSKSDVVDAIGASSYVPYWAGKWLTTLYRGEPVYDGSWGGPGEGFLPCPPGVTHCIRISSLPPGVSFGNFLMRSVIPTGAVGITATARTAADVTQSTHMNDPDAWRRYFVSGAFTNAINRNTTLFLRAFDPVLRIVSPGEGEADIWPGRRHPLPISSVQWLSHQAVPATPDVSKAMFDLGRAEAKSWAMEQGFVKPTLTGARRLLRVWGF